MSKTKRLKTKGKKKRKPITLQFAAEPQQIKKQYFQKESPKEYRGKRSLWRHVLRLLRRYLLTGIVVAMPLVITIYLVNWFISFVDNQMLPLLMQVASSETSRAIIAFPGLGLAIALIFLILLGWLTANVFGQSLVGYGERIVSRMPVVRTIYNALKQIFETVLSNRSSNFEEVVLVEYPRKDVHAVAFVTTQLSGEIPNLIKHKKSDDMVAIFLPTTPNPTSGFLLFVPRSAIKPLNMSVEDGIKMVISAGLIEPRSKKKK